jgi:hypothetical protein
VQILGGEKARECTGTHTLLNTDRLHLSVRLCLSLQNLSKTSIQRETSQSQLRAPMVFLQLEIRRPDWLVQTSHLLQFPTPLLEQDVVPQHQDGERCWYCNEDAGGAQTHNNGEHPRERDLAKP